VPKNENKSKKRQDISICVNLRFGNNLSGATGTLTNPFDPKATDKISSTN
jgi:hypothetical protein